MIAAGLTAAVYHVSCYLIHAIYGGVMKAYRAKQPSAIPKPPDWATDNAYLTWGTPRHKMSHEAPSTEHN